MSGVAPLSFRPLAEEDLPALGHWLDEPHVRAWWRADSDLEHLRRKYLPRIDGTEPTEVFVIVHDARDVGIIQRYRVRSYPEWDGVLAGAGVSLPDAAGIDYLIGVLDHVGRGTGTRVIDGFTSRLFADWPDVDHVVVTPQQANVASCRVLEKAGYELCWTGELDSDDPADFGTAALYVRSR
ncbi:MAG: GNAT family N-acetyltransferase [Acidimicrobiia bacterium]|nr:GNAT family N-acetyltransferase [Acidimicrobiia bacterium]